MKNLSLETSSLSFFRFKLIVILLLLSSPLSNGMALAIMMGSLSSPWLPQFPSFTPQNFTNDVTKECQAPLLYGPKDPETNVCLNNCCLACPYTNNFYKGLDSTYEILTSLGAVSFALSILLSISFLVLPSQRQNPTTLKILLPFALSVAFYQTSQLFSIKQETLCINDITVADINTDMTCRTQAVFGLAGAYAMGFWSAILMIHLHLLSVWRSDFIIRNIRYFHIITWTVTLLATVIPLAKNKIKANIVCFISDDSSFYYFSFLSFIMIAFLLHLYTFVYITKKVTLSEDQGNSAQTTCTSRTSMSEAQKAIMNVKSIVKVQWRAFFGASLMLIIYVLDLVFYVQLRKKRGMGYWIGDWMKCIEEGNMIDYCRQIAEPHIPSHEMLVSVLFFSNFIGVLVFIIFCAKKSIILEFWEIIKGRKPIMSISDDTNSSNDANDATAFECGSSNKLPIVIALKNWFGALNNKYLKSKKTTEISDNDMLRKESTTIQVSGNNQLINESGNIAIDANFSKIIGATRNHSIIRVSKIRDFNVSKKNVDDSGSNSRVLGCNNNNDNNNSNNNNDVIDNGDVNKNDDENKKSSDKNDNPPSDSLSTDNDNTDNNNPDSSVLNKKLMLSNELSNTSTSLPLPQDPHEKVPRMARASFGLDESSSSSAPSPTSERESCDSIDYYIKHTPGLESTPSSLIEQALSSTTNTTTTTFDNEGSHDYYQIQNMETSSVESIKTDFYTPPASTRGDNDNYSDIIIINDINNNNGGENNMNNNNNVNDDDDDDINDKPENIKDDSDANDRKIKSYSIDLFRTETFGNND